MLRRNENLWLAATMRFYNYFMRILLATSAIVPKGGGIASYNQELINAFRGIADFSVLTDEDIREFVGIDKVYSTFNHDCFSIDYCKEIVGCINNTRFDVIINSGSLLMAIIAPYVNAPICSVSHFVDGILALKAGFNSQYIARIIALSNYGKQHLEKRFSISNKSCVKVVYNFVHTETVELDKQKITKRPMVIVYPGGTSVKKSFDIVMKALKKLIKTKSDFRFYWLGGTTLPSARFCLASSCDKLIKYDSRVTFTGRIPREDAIRIMKSSNIFLLPSRGEGCPMTLLEAMQDGCIPVVSDAKHGSREILEDGDFGVIVRNEDENSLYHALCAILENADDYAINYQKSFEYTRRVLSEEKWRNSMLGIINDCMAMRKKMESINEKHFRANTRLIKTEIKKERIATIFSSMKSCLICNWLYLTRYYD